MCVCVCVLVAQSCPTLCNLMGCIAHQAPLSMCFPGKNTGVGCHFLLQYLLGDIHLKQYSMAFKKWDTSQHLPNENHLWDLWFNVNDVTVPGLIFSDCIELLHLQLQRI